ncbi:MAG: CPBP family glutamic-type intramembrane protease, partial [Synechococcaceae cyanobacterium]|nr:CPBP family glutamic-type intramembrane protease [Synechococcaceae cyanobacterium]
MRRTARSCALALLLVLALVLAVGLAGLPAPAERASAPAAAATSYALAQRAPFNRPSHYPLDQRPDPRHYRPHAEWMGRLILPAAAEAGTPPELEGRDWVWIELEQAPREELIGRRLRLTWQESADIRALVGAVRTGVRLGEAARRAAEAGNVVPTRLDGRPAVGPLESLAGARPHDDVTVRLELPRPGTASDGTPLLRIPTPPVQITGRWTALVRIDAPAQGGPGTGAVPAGEAFRVRHFNPASGRFDGAVETVRIPRQPPDRSGRRFFDPRGLASSPAGREGWYLHGSPDPAGTFTVQALEPRMLTRLAPDRTVAGSAAGLRHIHHGNWSDTPRRRGTLSRVAVLPDHPRRTLLSRRGEADGEWGVGDRALVIHGFGGIGGADGEPTPGFTVTGHFAFGQAEVVPDPFSGEPRFRIRYHQIYAHNPSAIVSGTQDWSAFSGDLQRGWMGTRPISDVLVRGEGVLLDALALQAEVLMARYRSGDGTGVAAVTPATSCVQDSAQALFIAIDQLRRRAAASPAVAAARAAGGPRGEHLRELSSLRQDLDALLTPFGMVRADWRRNATAIAAAESAVVEDRTRTAGIAGRPLADPFTRGQGLLDGLLSWRSMMPRRGHDELAGVFLRHGNPLWILRTNQLPGTDPRLEPLAPTLLLGRLPVVPILLRRLSDALFTPLTPAALALTAALLGIHAALVLPAGLRSGFLRRRRPSPLPVLLLHAAGLFVMPALVEELIFRVALLPHPLEGEPPATALAWAALSLGLFVAYHPIAGRLWYPPGRRLFRQPRFLLPCALLGVVCTVAYQVTGSLWPPVLLHGLVVLVWLEGL